MPVGDLLEAVLHETGYLDALEAERTIEAQGRIENLEALVEAAREFDARADEGEDTLDVFLQATSLLSDADTRRDDEGLVTLMTLHNAKGLEYPIVFIIGCEEGVFPHSRSVEEGSLEEERRLCYVGITRAMRDLYMTHARRRNVFGAATVGLREPLPQRDPAGPRRPRGVGDDLLGRASRRRARGRCRWGGGERPRRRGRVPHRRRRRARGVRRRRRDRGRGRRHRRRRFASDGSERKLMAEYAPITKRGT